MLALLITLLGPSIVLAQTPAGTAFTYQGSLRDQGIPATGLYDFVFSLHDQPTEGEAVGPSVSLLDIEVDRGLFTVALDFGIDAFTGDARWLEAAVKRAENDGPPVLLLPRRCPTASAR